MNLKIEEIEFELSDSVLEIFKKYIQDDLQKNESGGILTGKIFNSFIQILDCSEPTPLDYNSRFNFNRSHKAAQNFINVKFQKSQGKEIYLGEWHTHPEDTPTPSNIDINSFDKTLNKNKLNSDFHFMVIVGRTALYIGVYLYKKMVKRLIMDLP